LCVAFVSWKLVVSSLSLRGVLTERQTQVFENTVSIRLLRKIFYEWRRVTRSDLQHLGSPTISQVVDMMPVAGTLYTLVQQSPPSTLEDIALETVRVISSILPLYTPQIFLKRTQRERGGGGGDRALPSRSQSTAEAPFPLPTPLQTHRGNSRKSTSAGARDTADRDRDRDIRRRSPGAWGSTPQSAASSAPASLIPPQQRSRSPPLFAPSPIPPRHHYESQDNIPDAVNGTGVISDYYYNSAGQEDTYNYESGDTGRYHYDDTSPLYPPSSPSPSPSPPVLTLPSTGRGVVSVCAKSCLYQVIRIARSSNTNHPGREGYELSDIAIENTPVEYCVLPLMWNNSLLGVLLLTINRRHNSYNHNHNHSRAAPGSSMHNGSSALYGDREPQQTCPQPTRPSAAQCAAL
jgi:hypothetical protein